MMIDLTDLDDFRRRGRRILSLGRDNAAAAAMTDDADEFFPYSLRSVPSEMNPQVGGDHG